TGLEIQGDRLDALASRVGDQPEDVVSRVFSRFGATEQWCEAFMEPDQIAGRGAQCRRGHDHDLRKNGRVSRTGRFVACPFIDALRVQKREGPSDAVEVARGAS